MAERSERTKIDSDWVLQQLAAIDAMELLDILNPDFSLKPLDSWPLAWRKYFGSLELGELVAAEGDPKKMIRTLSKLKGPDKQKNLELIGKHVDVGAFKERVEHDAGAAFELLHAFALFHDDVMDGSASRRGVRTTHLSFADRHLDERWIGEARRFGEGVAILIGDLAFVYADQLLHGASVQAWEIWSELRIELKYHEGRPVIREISRISKPGRRVYSKIKDLPKVYNGLGISILSTPKGVMSDNEARAANLGGEVLCRVF